jgi:hypothetical protein
MEILNSRTCGALKHATKAPVRKSVKPAVAPKLSPDTEKIARLARRLKGAFGSGK